MPTFSRTTCNGVTVEPEAGVVDTPHVHTHTHTHTHERWKEEQQREKPELPTRFAKLHQLFGHSLATCAKSTSVYPALHPLTVSDTAGAHGR